MHVQWVAKYIIYTWNLPSFFDCFLTVDEHLENPTTLNLSRLVNFRNKAVSIYLALMIFNFIPANSAKWGEMLDVNIHKTNKVVLALKRKRQRLMLMRKKVITRLCEKPGSWKCTCFGPWNSTIIYQNSRTSTIPTLNMIKINRYDNRGKYLQLRKKSVNRKKNRYLFTYLENRPKTRLHIALYDLYLTSAVLVLTAEVKYSSRKIAIKTAREGEKTDDTWLS